MATRTRNPWLDDEGSPAEGPMPEGGMTRSRRAREEADSAFAEMNAAVVGRVMSGDHEGFLDSVRQSGGQ